MNIMIRIGLAPEPAARSPWTQHGLLDNPFPPSGVDTEVDYEDHQKLQVERINHWLTSTVDSRATKWSPLVLKGSVGVGKTHVLKRIERALVEYHGPDPAAARRPASVAVTRQTIPGISSKSLLLSSLLSEGLRAATFGDADVDGAEFPLLQGSLNRLLDGELDPRALPPTSPLATPLRRIREDANPSRRRELAEALTSWIARRDVARAKLDRLGLHGKLEGEGEAIRAYAHVARLAKASGGLCVWVVLLDQIEDLWRKNEVTPTKRARFLTDLRTLIDEALEGAPVAVVLAWNTDVVEGAKRRSTEVENPLRTEYVALWSRLPEPIDIPSLPREHALAFAKAYVDAENSRFVRASEEDAGKLPRPTGFMGALQKNLSDVLSNVPKYGRMPDGSVVERAWLTTLRVWADEYVKAPGSVR